MIREARIIDTSKREAAGPALAPIPSGSDSTGTCPMSVGFGLGKGAPAELCQPVGGGPAAALADGIDAITDDSPGYFDADAVAQPGLEPPPDPSTPVPASIDAGSATQSAASVAGQPYDASAKQKAGAKTSRIPIKVVPAGEVLKKPAWIRVRAGSHNTRFYEIKDILRTNKLHTVCEEASCPNIGECFGKGTATFMIMGDKCTRRCPFCDVGHGRPDPLDAAEPENMARTIAALKLKYVVITSVDRDDLRDGGAGHFADCIRKTRELSPATRIEVLVPDFRGRLDIVGGSRVDVVYSYPEGHRVRLVEAASSIRVWPELGWSAMADRVIHLADGNVRKVVVNKAKRSPEEIEW